jgi:GTP-binding protein
VSRPLDLRFVLSADRLEALPGVRAEVAVVGRSNVGKSSLLNALAARKGLANTSKTPGRTQLLNCFSLDADDGPLERTVVDCPGYGYASVSKTTRAAWGRMIERYLLEREPLTMVLALVDGEIGPTKLDVQMLDWIRAHERPHTVVATKHDKVRSAHRARRRADLAAGCQLEPGDVVWVSATKGTGVDDLRSLVRVWLAP